MTREEARELLQTTPIDIRSPRDDLSPADYFEALNLATEALEKQIPKKFSEFDSVWCPSCGENVFDLSNDCSFNYCPYCGQALDWSEE